uniref:Prokineticin 2 n=1 Tax=Cyprinus carpio TaxID=7962 RepID=A0A8C2KI66_CYPCA
MTSNISVFLCLVLVSCGSTAVITGACEKDSQCGGGMCCAVSLWIRSLRMCIPMGRVGEDCHPMSHKVYFFTFLLTFIMIFFPVLLFLNSHFYLGAVLWQETPSYMPLSA